MEKRLNGKVKEIIKGKEYKIYVYMPYDPVLGIYPHKTKNFHGTKPDADTYLRDWLTRLENPKKKYSEQPLGEYLLHWMDVYRKPDLEQNSYKRDRGIIVNNINPYLGHIPLGQLDTKMIKDTYAYLLEFGKGERPLGRVIRSYRLQKGLSRLEFGKMLGIKAKIVEAWERGKETPKDLKPITDALELTVEQLNDRYEGLSPRTVKYVHTILKHALDDAVELDMIPKNPVGKLKPPKDKEKPKDKWVVLDADDLVTFLEGCRSHRDFVLINTAANTGARESELLGLTKDMILFDKKAIKIKQALHRDKDQEDGFEQRPRTKNQTSERVVAVDDDTLNILREHLTNQLKKNLATGARSNLVFTEPNGQPINAGNLAHRFENLVKKLGHPAMTFHHLRHTHATILLSDGVYVNEVAERLGHADAKVTLAIYGHILPKKKSALASRFSAILRPQNLTNN